MSNRPPTVNMRHTELQQHIAEINRLAKRVNSDVAEMGRRLTACHDIVGHGGWLKFLDREFGWTVQTAHNCMNVYKASVKFPNFGNLKLPPSTLYLLAAPSTPENVLHHVLERAESGESLTHAQVQTLITGAKAKGSAERHEQQNPPPAAETPKSTPGQTITTAEVDLAAAAAEEEPSPANGEPAEHGEADVDIPMNGAKVPGMSGHLMTYERSLIVGAAARNMKMLSPAEQRECLVQALAYNSTLAEVILPVVVDHLPAPIRWRTGRPQRPAKPITDPFAKIARLVVHALAANADVALADLQAINNVLARAGLNPPDLKRAIATLKTVHLVDEQQQQSHRTGRGY